MTEKKPSFINSYTLGNEIPSITETISKFARQVINIQRHDVTNDVIIFERDSRHFTNVINANNDNRQLQFFAT